MNMCPDTKTIEGCMEIITAHEHVMEDHDRLVRELDVLLNGENAAKQASLCDIVAQVRNTKMSPFKKPTCRGSYQLGTACGHCERCEKEKAINGEYRRILFLAGHVAEAAIQLVGGKGLNFVSEACDITNVDSAAKKLRDRTERYNDAIIQLVEGKLK